MKCINAERLLPLYARLDLDKNSHSAVSAHLESCAHCRQLADEYKNIQSWIRVYEPPEFSEEFFAGIRQNVLREIGQRSVASSTFSTWLQKLVAPAVPKRIFAGATAALLIISFGIGFLVLRESGNPTELIAKDEAVKSEPQNGAVPAKPVTPPAEDKSQVQEVKTGPGSRVAFVGPSGNNVNRVRRKIARTTPAATTLTAQDTLTTATELTSTDSSGERSIDSGLSGGQAPLRVEMQTQNPNIRIIWFAPNAKQSSATQ